MDQVLRLPAVMALERLYGRDAVRVQGQHLLDELRDRLKREPLAPEDLEDELSQLPTLLVTNLHRRYGAPVARVINATGIFLHTNLGRAPLPASVARELAPLLTAGCDLEIDRLSGRRGDRNSRVGALLAELTGAEAAVVVNNNAAAMILVLATLARDREVVVSRGELVEIGGSFRIPEILAEAGARLVEVGTTNRTRVADYEAAIGEHTALLLKVFPSNYRIEGFTEAASPAELARLSQRRGIPLLVDEGSGLLRSSSRPQLAAHPSLTELMGASCDLACGSGDKLAGGPQAGLLVGRRELVEACRRHPLYRALRPHRGTLAALELVLRRHLAGDSLPLDDLWPDPEALHHRLEAAAESLRQRGVNPVHVVDADAFLGGGSAPQEPVPGRALAIPAAQGTLRRLRLGTPAVVGYLRDGQLMLDLRTVTRDDDDALLSAVARAVLAQ